MIHRSDSTFDQLLAPVLVMPKWVSQGDNECFTYLIIQTHTYPS